MSSKRAKGKTTKKRPQRATSNVFAMFDQSQIQEFKEAFNMIDQNRDGFVDKEDLHDMLASLGKNPTDEYLEAMMTEAPGPINFTMFLTMFGEKLNGTDPEDVIRNAFACFDEEGTGVIQEEYLRELLTTMGDRFTDEEVDELFREAPIDKKSNFNYLDHLAACLGSINPFVQQGEATAINHAMSPHFSTARFAHLFEIAGDCEFAKQCTKYNFGSKRLCYS
uniref:Myosin, light chain 12, genome duplicate 1 n=1 Tax=Esox lucius TaxID=8010 RepID=A0A3P8Y3E6_ESOLU